MGWNAVLPEKNSGSISYRDGKRQQWLSGNMKMLQEYYLGNKKIQKMLPETWRKFVYDRKEKSEFFSFQKAYEISYWMKEVTLLIKGLIYYLKILLCFTTLPPLNFYLRRKWNTVSNHKIGVIKASIWQPRNQYKIRKILICLKVTYYMIEVLVLRFMGQGD